MCKKSCLNTTDGIISAHPEMGISGRKFLFSGWAFITTSAKSALISLPSYWNIGNRMTSLEEKYREAVAYLYGLQKFGIKFGLSKTSNLLAAMGNPHVGRRYVHVAGTNGKGSVCSFIASVLKEAGLRVGLYTSPHLVRFTERFKIDGNEMDRKTVVDLVAELKTAVAPEGPPTYFEATTAMALSFFKREDTDLDIMEVGMGGRLDATNVITPLVSVITNISMEHREYLGPGLLQIASEKAGIVKQGIDVVAGVTQPSVAALVRSVCREKGAPLWLLGKDVRYRYPPSGLSYQGMDRRLRGLRLGLFGAYQGRNAALALAAIERLEKKGVALSEDNIRMGLRNAVWPGRMHVVSENPKLLLDGAHNPAAIRTLITSVRKGFSYRRLLLVIGVMKDKEIGPMLAAIVPHADFVFYTRPVYSRAADPETLMVAAEPFGKPGRVVVKLSAAIDLAKKEAGPQDLIVVCGSLFTVGEALAYLNPGTYGSVDP